MWKPFSVLICRLIGLALVQQTGNCESYETKYEDGPEHNLYSHLFQNYNSEVRPVKNASHIIDVVFALSLNQLLDLDEKSQVLTTSIWVYEEWYDELLVWNPKGFRGQKMLMIPATSIWLPDLFIFNAAGASADGFVNVNGSKAAVDHTGHVRWMVPAMVNSACAVDVTYFPYDRQDCSILFGSWIYDINQLNIKTDSSVPDLENYVINSEYDMTNVSITRIVVDSSCCPGNGRHPMVKLHISLKRKSLYYDYIVIAPTIMLCVLTLASFLLPCDKGEKMAIGLTVFLTLYVLQLRIADNVPDTNSTPILGIFMLIVMTFNSLSLVMATIVMNIKKRGEGTSCPDVPAWLFFLCSTILAKIVCTLWKESILLPEPFSSYKNKTEANTPNSKGNKNISLKQITSESKLDSSDSKTMHKNKIPPSKNSVFSDTQGKYEYSKETIPSANIQKRKIKNSKKHRNDNLETPKKQDIVDHENSSSLNAWKKQRWFYIAEVVDKCSFLVYLILLSVSIFSVLFVIPVYFGSDS